ncbi:Ger(x)C family germination protein [Alicyclobacillus sacchari]|uniref:Ger(X)C family germination protein n=2 Tax=Alicyclobacillus sacchari TaxID=392010 RepID=A0A4R8LP21_9BACL|nr:Ger(x)C family germination protein [Alicyclobacillus sacchari]
MMFLVLLCVTGCGDYQKINERSQIIGVGVDAVPGRNDVLAFTLQIPNLEKPTSQSMNLGTSGRQGGESQPYKNFYVEATSLQSALARAQTTYDKSFFLGNMETIVFQSQLSEQAVMRVTEQMMRDESLDKLAVVVASPSSARSVLEANTSSPPATYIESMWTRSIPQRGFTAPTRLWEFWRDAELIGREPHMPLVETLDDGVKVGGTLAFQGYRPVWALSPDDTVFYNLLAHDIHALALNIPDGDKSFDIKNTSSRSSFYVTDDHGMLTLHDSIQVNADLASSEGLGQRPTTNAESERYEDVIESYVRENALNVLKRLQENQTDIVGFGFWYMIKHPKAAMLVRDQWSDMFRHARLDVQVHCTISREGNLI